MYALLLSLLLQCSYNALNIDDAGITPACAMGSLQETWAREHLKFNGSIVSDCGAISDFLDFGHCSGCSWGDGPLHHY